MGNLALARARAAAAAEGEARRAERGPRLRAQPGRPIHSAAAHNTRRGRRGPVAGEAHSTEAAFEKPPGQNYKAHKASS